MKKWCTRPWIYFGLCITFLMTAIILCYQILGRTITATDWIVAALVVILGVGIICVLGPETIIRKHDNDYTFPSTGYFEQFLK